MTWIEIKEIIMSSKESWKQKLTGAGGKGGSPLAFVPQVLVKQPLNTFIKSNPPKLMILMTLVGRMCYMRAIEI